MNGFDSWESADKMQRNGQPWIAWKVTDRDGVEVYGMARNKAAAYKDAQKEAGKSH